MVSGYYVRSLIHFKLTFVSDLNRGLISFFCMWLSNFPNTIYSRHCPSFTESSWLPYQMSVAYICEDVFLNFQFCSIGLHIYFYVSTILV